MTFKKALFAALPSILLLATSLNAAPTEDGLYAVFDTNKGSFTTELFFEKAPLSSANFVGLAEGTLPHYQNGSDTPIYSKFYDGLTFHRIIDGFVIQGGDPNGNGSGGPGYSWPDEVHPDLKHQGEGILSMANSGANTNGSQFFVTLDTTSSLDGIHNVFGKVVEGISVVRSIGSTPTSGDAPTSPITINSIEILRIGAAANAFDPTFYANHFDPFIPLFGQSILSPTQVDATGSDTFTVSTAFAPLTEFRVFTSNDLENWEQTQLISPSLDPDTAAPSALLAPASDDGPRFATIDVIKRSVSDMSGIIDQIKIESQYQGTDYVEIIKIQPDLVGTYTINSSSEIPVYIDWIEISPTRTQVQIYFYQTTGSAIQLFLDRSAGLSGNVYIRDQNSTASDSRDDLVIEGTFTLTPAD